MVSNLDTSIAADGVPFSPSRRGGIVKQKNQESSSYASGSSSKRKLDLIAPESDSRGDPKRERILSSATRIYIISDKLTEDEMDALRVKVSSLGGMNSSLSYATLILTQLRAGKRVLRHLNSDVLVSKGGILEAHYPRF